MWDCMLGLEEIASASQTLPSLLSLGDSVRSDSAGGRDLGGLLSSCSFSQPHSGVGCGFLAGRCRACLSGFGRTMGPSFLSGSLGNRRNHLLIHTYTVQRVVFPPETPGLRDLVRRLQWQRDGSLAWWFRPGNPALRCLK